jgi:hypothetical protein
MRKAPVPVNDRRRHHHAPGTMRHAG